MMCSSRSASCRKWLEGVLLGLEKREASLEDVFIDLVGRGLDVDTSHDGEDEGAQTA